MMRSPEFSALSDRFPPTPRKIKASGNQLFMMATVILVTLGAALYLIGDLASNYRDTLSLLQRGVDLVASVRELHVESGKGHNHIVGFAYALEGKIYENKGAVSEQDYVSLKLGDPLPILVDPLNAQLAKINIAGSARNPRALGNDIAMGFFVLVLFGSLSIFFTFFSRRPYRREKRLLTWGEVARATILTKEVFHNKGHRYFQIGYSFTAPGGGKYFGEITGLPIDTPRMFFDEPIVFYDPHKPKVNAFYPMRNVTLAEEPRLQ